MDMHSTNLAVFFKGDYYKFGCLVHN